MSGSCEIVPPGINRIAGMRYKASFLAAISLLGLSLLKTGFFNPIVGSGVYYVCKTAVLAGAASCGSGVCYSTFFKRSRQIENIN
jgi:hypothetical protein